MSLARSGEVGWGYRLVVRGLPGGEGPAGGVPYAWSVIINDALPGEYPVVGQLRVAAYQALGLLPESNPYIETLRTFGFDDGCSVLVARDPAGGDILGTITLEPFGQASELARDKTEADVRAFAVSPAAQGHGIGRELLLAVIERASKHGFTRLRLCTQPAMKAAQRLYAVVGFSRTPELDFTLAHGVTLRAYALPVPNRGQDGNQPG